MIERALTIVGDRFGARVVVDFGTHHRRGRQALVECECGDRKWVLLADLRAGRSDRCRPCRDKRNGAMLRDRCIRRSGRPQTVTCPYCGHTTQQRLTRAEKVQAVRCGCGSVFTHTPKDQPAT